MSEHVAVSWWSFVLLGLAGGVLSGTLGIGSGTLFIPVLVLAFGFGQKPAQAMSLAVMIPMALAAVIRYRANPDARFDVAQVALLGIGAVLGALAGAELARWLPGTLLRRVFAVYIILAGLHMLVSRANLSDRKMAEAQPKAAIHAVADHQNGGSQSVDQ